VTKLSKATVLHKTFIKEMQKPLTEKKATWASKRDNLLNLRRKEENDRIKNAKRYTTKYGDELVKERAIKEKEMANKDSELYLERFQSRLELNKSIKKQEELVVNQSLALLETTNEQVANNLQRRKETILAKQEIMQNKKSVNL
jgi:hypothetical protein